MTLIVSLVAALSLSLLGSLLNDAAAAVKANEKLAALIKAAQTEGMLNLVWGENTFRGLHGVRELVSRMNKEFGTSIIANWTPGPSQPQMAAKIAQEFAAGVPSTSDVYIGGSETYIATLATRLMVLDQFDWAATFPQIDPAAVSLKGAALEISGRFPGIVYNTKLISQNDVPKSLKDLLNPRLKGKVSTQPYISYFDILSGPKLWVPNGPRITSKSYRPRSPDLCVAANTNGSSAASFRSMRSPAARAACCLLR